MKKLILIFILFPVILSSQSNTDIKEAVDFLNIYLTNETWISNDTGGFNFNKYANTLDFKRKVVSGRGKKIIRKEEYLLNLENVANIKETIHRAEENKINDINFIVFELNLKKEIYRKYSVEKEGDVLPEYDNSKVKKVYVQIAKQLTSQDLVDLQRVIRDIFLNVPIETVIK